jgi:hypothetical protein
VSHAFLVNAFVVGAAVLAIWFRARLGDRKPKSLKVAAVHVVLAGLALAFMPTGIGRVLGDDPAPGTSAVGLFGLFLPAMTYVMLSALWLLERLQRLLEAR